MSDIHSLMIVGSILGLGGLGLFMYKTDEECDDESSKKIEKIEETEKITKIQEPEDEEVNYKRAKTKKSRRRGGGTRRSTFEKG